MLREAFDIRKACPMAHSSWSCVAVPDFHTPRRDTSVSTRGNVRCAWQRSRPAQRGQKVWPSAEDVIAV